MIFLSTVIPSVVTASTSSSKNDIHWSKLLGISCTWKKMLGRSALCVTMTTSFMHMSAVIACWLSFVHVAVNAVAPALTTARISPSYWNLFRKLTLEQDIHYVQMSLFEVLNINWRLTLSTEIELLYKLHAISSRKNNAVWLTNLVCNVLHQQQKQQAFLGTVQNTAFPWI